jgi:hypothetical protein
MVRDFCELHPGDLIKWVYESDSQPVRENDELWSMPMQRYIPIGVQPMMLISITDEFYSWLTPKGCSTRAWMTRVVCSPKASLGRVVPRIIGEHR